MSNERWALLTNANCRSFLWVIIEKGLFRFHIRELRMEYSVFLDIIGCLLEKKK